MKAKRLLLIGLYMAIIYCIILAEIHYAQKHPMQDDAPAAVRRERK